MENSMRSNTEHYRYNRSARYLLIAGACICAIWLSSCGFLGYEASHRPPSSLATPKFTPIDIPFEHNWNKTIPAHPLVGSAAIDVDGDGDDEIFLGGGKDQRSALLDYKDGKLIDISQAVGLKPSGAVYAAISLDFDRDGDVDLITSGQDGIVLLRNQKGKFTQRRLPIADHQSAVPTHLAVADIDLDGDLDFYVSMFVKAKDFKSATFNDPSHAKKNFLYRNIDNLRFVDITTDASAGKQNTFVSSFADLDRDGYPDLILAQNTGESEILFNHRGKSFRSSNIQTGFGFWMGIGLSDFDNDQDVDIVLSNVGNSIPKFLAKGDLNETQSHRLDWLFLRNEGKGEFTDITQKADLTDYGFAWGVVFHDVNGDAQQDLLVAQNYVKWPVHKVIKLPGKTLLGDPNFSSKFYTSDSLDNRGNYGGSPLLADVDGNGRVDVFWVNMVGQSKGYLNKSRDDFVAVRLEDDGSWENHIFEVQGRHVVYLPQQGLGSDQTSLVSLPLPSSRNLSEVLLIKNSKGEVVRKQKLDRNSLTNLSR